jgi:homogentisate 1,2-dioxygenase
MSHYRRVGRVPPKRHTVFLDDDGTRLLEELMGTAGFSGPSSLLYHRASPSALIGIEPVADDRPDLTANHPVTPLHVRTDQVAPASADLVTGRTVLAGNDDLTLAVATADAVSPAYRNAVGDELVFVHDGEATLETVFGPLMVGEGDYVVIPAGTTHRWVPAGRVQALVVEAAGHVRVPGRYRNDDGQFLEHAPYCERDLRAPESPPSHPHTGRPPPADVGYSVLVRTRAGLSRHQHVNDPFDVVGWDGGLYPYAFSIHDFEPIVGRLHQPPPVHLTFEGPAFVVCSFVPRPFDFHPDAVKVPYHHANVDSDEVLYYVAGDFMSRAGSGIGVGSMTIHPAGFVHGPQPGSWERSVSATHTNEVAVMIDTFAPLRLAPAARDAADPAYLRSWAGPES